MISRSSILYEIEKLPQKYIEEVLNFISYLQQKHISDTNEKANEDEITLYKLMASDTEREMEAREWCNAYFGPTKKK